jgi:hypothetical protein
MRALPILAVAASMALAGACVPSPPITIVRIVKKAKLGEAVEGDPVRVRHPPPDSYAGLRTGAYVVRSVEDWNRMWRHVSDVPELPQDLDTSKDMLLVLANQDETIGRLWVTRVVETGGHVAVFLRETTLGEGCVRRPEDPFALDAVIIPRIEKPLKIYIEEVNGEACGAPPKVEIACRLATAQTWSSKMTAKSGDVVECELSSTLEGKYALVDQMLSLVDIPPGSKAKLAFSKRSTTRATLALDAFGTYAIRAEATDEAGRKGQATARIDVVPKKTRDVLLQLSWADLDEGDPATPLPRVLLRVAQEGPRGQRCSAEVPVPGLCEAKTRGPYTYMKIPARHRRKLAMSLLYLDERPQAGPSPCVNVWFNGERTASICDRDHRHAEDRWEIGIVDTANGKIAAPKPPPEPKPKKPTKPAEGRAAATVAATTPAPNAER